MLDSLQGAHDTDLPGVAKKTIAFLRKWGRIDQNFAVPRTWALFDGACNQQENSTDCGIFLLAFCRILTERQDPALVTQHSINHFRRLVILELILGNLCPL